MKKNLIAEWMKVQETHDNSEKRNFLRDVSFQDLYDAALAEKKTYLEKKEQLEEAERNYRIDCAEKDNSLNFERENLKKEIEKQERAIKEFSKKITNALVSHDRDKVPQLRKQISEATMMKDEAVATLKALSDAVPEYDNKLLQKAEQYKEPEQEAWNTFGEYFYQIASMWEVLEKMFSAFSAEHSELNMLHER